MGSEPLERALANLEDPSDTTRLAAARTVHELMTELLPEIEEKVRRALAKESVPWVRGALADILEGSDALDEGIVVSAPRWDERLDELDPEIARQVINLSTKRVLHEVSAVVGRARLAASLEFPDGYLGSETARHLEFLSEVCTGLRTLTTATDALKPIEFDLSAELKAVGESIADEHVFPVITNGPAPFIIRTDRTLLHLAVRNVLVNAVEASLSIGPADDARAIVLTWGSSADGSHATVIDRGPGPPRFLASMQKPGVSTKDGHPGYGLATASEAMRSLGGSVEIQRNDRGGATVVLAWTEDERG